MKRILVLILGLIAAISTSINGIFGYLPHPGASACGAITVPDGLKRDQILNTALLAFKRKLLPLLAFSTVFKDVILQGTDIVHVPFVPLQQVASSDFDPAVGYSGGDGTLETRPITINKRKFQKLSITGNQLARQPVLELEEIFVKKAEQLAEDVITDIFSVLTAANYGAAIFTGASAGFDIDAILLLRKACVDAMWPESGRSLILNSEYDTAALSDRTVLQAFSYGDNSVIKDGKLPRVAGFDYYSAPVFPTNAEHLVGIAAMKYAILTAFAPIEPPPGVRKLMLDYAQMSDDNGLTLEFRQLADPFLDTDYHIIECNYGSAKGDAAQAKRVVSQ